MLNFKWLYSFKIALWLCSPLKFLLLNHSLLGLSLFSSFQTQLFQTLVISDGNIEGKNIRKNPEKRFNPKALSILVKEISLFTSERTGEYSVEQLKTNCVKNF